MTCPAVILSKALRTLESTCSEILIWTLIVSPISPPRFPELNEFWRVNTEFLITLDMDEEDTKVNGLDPLELREAAMKISYAVSRSSGSEKWRPRWGNGLIRPEVVVVVVSWVSVTMVQMQVLIVVMYVFIC